MENKNETAMKYHSKKAKTGELELAKGETALVPAAMKRIVLQADGETEVLEMWIN